MKCEWYGPERACEMRTLKGWYSAFTKVKIILIIVYNFSVK